MYTKRKIFFNCLLIALIVLSIFTASKITVLLNIPIACSFFIFPLIYLCICMLNELGGAKESIISLLSATGILVISYIIISIIVNVPNQVTTINEANALQLLVGNDNFSGYYIPNMKMILGSIIGLLVSGFALIGIYSLTSRYTYKTISCFLSTLISLLLFNAIYVTITQFGIISNHDFIMMMLNRFIFSVVWTFIISILFLIFSHKNKVASIDNKTNKTVKKETDVVKKTIKNDGSKTKKIVKSETVEQKKAVKKDASKTSKTVKKETNKTKK